MPNANANRRIRQIDISLEELSQLSITPGLNADQRNAIVAEVRKLMAERDNLEANHDHWLADTQPSMKAIVDIVQNDIHNSSNQKVSRT